MIENISAFFVNVLSKIVVYGYKGRIANDPVSIEFSKRYAPLKIWILRKKSFLGFSIIGLTLGNNIFVYHHPSTWLLGHELYHIQHQWKKYGNRFLFMYVAEFFRCWFKYGLSRAYSQNRYEKDAYGNQWIYQNEIFNFIQSGSMANGKGMIY